MKYLPLQMFLFVGFFLLPKCAIRVVFIITTFIVIISLPPQTPCVFTLVELSLDDPDHGSNPVVRADGYRHFILCTLKSVRSLDGITITSRARSNAEELYVERVLAFNDRVDQVRRDNERELLAIEARKQRNMANADGLRVSDFLFFWCTVRV